MQKSIRMFTKEFKLEAVQLLQSSQKSQAHIARDLGIANAPSAIALHTCKYTITS